MSLSLGPSNFALLCALHTVVGHHQILGPISKYFTISLFLLHVHPEVVLITVKCFFVSFLFWRSALNPFAVCDASCYYRMSGFLNRFVVFLIKDSLSIEPFVNCGEEHT